MRVANVGVSSILFSYSNACLFIRAFFEFIGLRHEYRERHVRNEQRAVVLSETCQTQITNVSPYERS